MASQDITDKTNKKKKQNGTVAQSHEAQSEVIIYVYKFRGKNNGMENTVFASFFFSLVDRLSTCCGVLMAVLLVNIGLMGVCVDY